MRPWPRSSPCSSPSQKSRPWRSCVYSEPVLMWMRSLPRPRKTPSLSAVSERKAETGLPFFLFAPEGLNRMDLAHDWMVCAWAISSSPSSWTEVRTNHLTFQPTLRDGSGHEIAFPGSGSLPKPVEVKGLRTTSGAINSAGVRDGNLCGWDYRWPQ